MGILKYAAKYLAVAIVPLLLTTKAVCDEFVVFTQLETPYKLSRQQIKQVFLGARLEKNGEILQPIVLAPGHPWRTVFNIRVMGLTESRLQSYWAQVKFTGKRKPPLQVDDFAQMLQIIDNQKGTIGVASIESIQLDKYQIIYQFSD
ncbi:hypothetical protein DS2_00730 [Catenovulum agarivorans DS-2]|uniref:Uncharacterized protein n=1 Tax=Catenovulum agarivorans DS-2 TaxID=1328313 RepID=W7QJY1_9ALTE|nr:hypothetical protein [Catenovulum agarivorans]EWH12201.1 hypothetical protein DS2_00730 [Catenovulum agarivorans DS-2]